MACWMPSQSNPSCSTNLASSAAIIARFSWTEMRSIGHPRILQARARVDSLQLGQADCAMKAVSRRRVIAPPPDVRRVPQLQQHESGQQHEHRPDRPAQRQTHGSVSAGWPQQPENRIGVGAHAAPERKAFRGLLDQHAEPVRGARRTLRARPMRGTASSGRHRSGRRRRACAVKRRCGHNPAGTDAAQSQAGRVDDDVELLAGRARLSGSALIGPSRSNCAADDRSPSRASGWRSPVAAAARRARLRRCRARAPPAPSTSSFRPAIVSPRLRVRSRTSPAPSVLSPNQWSPRHASVLQARAACARGLRSRANANACSLNGIVTLRPSPFASANRSGPSRRSRQAAPAAARSVMRWPVARAKAS